MSDFVPSADELVEHNAEFAAQFADHDLQVAPLRKMAVVACMDSRMDTFKLLGLENGEAHIIRNAGGIVSDDVIRSLCLSQRALGTREILLVHHTDCGLQKVTDDGFRNQLEAELGIKPVCRRAPIDAAVKGHAVYRRHICPGVRLRRHHRRTARSHHR
jgi:carbonic anhydrase